MRTTEMRKTQLARFDLETHEINRVRGPVGMDLGARTPVNRCWLLVSLAVIAAITSIASSAASGVRSIDSSSNLTTKPMKVRFNLDGQVLTATLNDSQASRDFVALLPLDVTLNDYASTEKISDLPKRLSTQDAPVSIKPLTGDVTYYAPWGNLALFYRDGQQSSGLVRLGRFDSDIDALKRPGAIGVRIELVR